jgi:hypothetical protein
LLPTIWTGPVLAPLVVSICLIAAAGGLLVGEARGRPYRAPLRCWVGIVLGGLIVILSFTHDCRAILAGGMPERFAWELFAFGLLVGLGSFAYGWLRPPHR